MLVNGDGRDTAVCKVDDVKELIKKLQAETQDSRGLLHQGDYEGMSRQELKELIESKEKKLAELQHEMDEEEDKLVVPCRTERPPKLTEKMHAYQIWELNKKD